MKKNLYSYEILEEYILRAPLLSFKDLAHFSIENLKELCLNPIISEAIYLSSPELHKEMIKYFDKSTSKQNDKMVITLSKFLYRMSSRAIPFGLFSGCSVGKFGEEHNILLQSPRQHGRLTQLDMNFLCALVQQLEEVRDNRHSIVYYPNNSIYFIGDHVRYIESKYLNFRKQYFTMSISNTEFINLVIEHSRNGIKIHKLVDFLKGLDPEIVEEDALNFVHDLIDNQILVSSISACLTGGKYILKLKEELPSQDGKAILNQIDKLLNNVDNSEIGNSLNYYDQIIHEIDKFQIDYDKKYLFQTDLILNHESNKINKNITKNLKKALVILNKLTVFSEDSNLENFKRKFYDRYEDEEVPLALALDVETGVGYGRGTNSEDSYDISPLIDNLDLKGSRQINGFQQIKWSATDEFLHKKLMDNFGDFEIELTDDDLETFEADWSNLPLSFSLMLNIFNDNNEEPLIHIDYAGGATASFLLGRFCHSSKDILNHVKMIIEKEEQLSDHVFAEIVHLPEDRIGNIIYRPSLRKHEIPYMANSGVPLQDQILISDLMVSVKHDKIILRSKTSGKIIEPRMANAHNFSFNSLPIYQFLCDIQTQGVKHNLTFSWDNASRNLKFLPRVKYKNIILSLAKWIINHNEILELTSASVIQNWRKKRNIPTKVFVIDSGTSLFIDFENQMSVDVFRSIIKNKTEVTLKEFLFEENAPMVHHNKKPFTNELIVSFYKNELSNT